MHPLQRTFLSVLFAAIVCFITRGLIKDPIVLIIATWCAFALSFLVTSWIVIFSRTIPQIKKYAQKEDGSRMYVSIFTIGASFAAMGAVALLLSSSDKSPTEEVIRIALCFLSILLSWGLVHTLLSFHYAHLWYDHDKKEKDKTREGLNFPGDELPDYLDFAYFSFVVGMTFQVSDVEVQDKIFRRLVLLHAILSFLLNTFVVALTVNFIAGAKK